MILHTVNQSPYQSNTLTNCIKVATPNSSLLLIEDGVYGAVESTSTRSIWDKIPESMKCYALKEDLLARGLHERCADSFTIVDYAEFVALAIQHHTVQSWF